MAQSTAARLTALENSIATLVAALTPAQGAPVAAQAAAPLYVSDKPRCSLHAASACTRKLSKASESHVACAGEGDAMHGKLRASHRHF